MIKAVARGRLVDRVVPMLVMLLVAAAMGAKVQGGIGPGADNAKFQYLGEVLGTPHATGYPTFVLLDAAWVRLLPDTWSLALRANLLSLVIVSIAAGLIALTLRSSGVGAALGCAAALWWASAPAVVESALFAEVYGLHALILVAIWWRTLVAIGPRGSKWDLVLVGVLFGLGLGNHLTIVSFGPAWLVLFVGGRRECGSWISLRTIRQCATVGLVALAVAAVLYGYPFWRTAAPSTRYLEMSTPDLSSLLWYLGGAQFRDFLPAIGLGETMAAGEKMLAVLWSEVSWAILPMVFGLPLMSKRVRGSEKASRRNALAWGGSVTLAVLLPLFFACTYRIPDPEGYYVAPLLFAVLLAGGGAARLVDRVTARIARRRRRQFVVALESSVSIAVILWIVAFRLTTSTPSDLLERAAERRLDAVALLEYALDAPVMPATEESAVRTVIVAPDSPWYQALQYLVLGEEIAGAADQREVFVATPLVGPQFAQRLAEFLNRHDPPAGPSRYFDAARSAEDLVEGLRAGRPLGLIEERLSVNAPYRVLIHRTMAELVEGAGGSLERALPGWFWLTGSA